MEQLLKPDSTYWNIFEHIDRVSTWVEAIADLSSAKAILFGLLFLIPFLAAFAFLLKQFHVPDDGKKWWFIGFIIVYAASIFYVKIESEHTFENYSLKKRVLNEMVYRLIPEIPAQDLCNSLSIVESDLIDLSGREPNDFHFRKNEESIGMFSVINEDILTIINKKKNDLEETIVAEKLITLDSIQSFARNTGFGNIEDDVIQDVVNNNDKLVYIEKFRVVELKDTYLQQFSDLPIKSQEKIAADNFSIITFQKERMPFKVASQIDTETPNNN